MATTVKRRRSGAKLALIYLGGVVFGFGLALSRMVRPEVVLDFLQWDDLGLLFVMGVGAVIAGMTFHLASRYGRRPAPLTGESYDLRRKPFDRYVLPGGAIFGVGWGLSGLCPGAAYASLGVGNWPVLIGIAGMFLGALLHGYIRSIIPDHAEQPAATESQNI